MIVSCVSCVSWLFSENLTTKHTDHTKPHKKQDQQSRTVPRPGAPDRERDPRTLHIHKQCLSVRRETGSRELASVHCILGKAVKLTPRIYSDDIFGTAAVLAQEQIAPRRDTDVVGCGERIGRTRFDDERECSLRRITSRFVSPYLSNAIVPAVAA